MTLTVRGHTHITNEISAFYSPTAGLYQYLFSNLINNIGTIKNEIPKPTVVEGDFMICYAVYSDVGTFRGDTWNGWYTQMYYSINYWKHDLSAGTGNYTYTAIYESTDLRPLDVGPAGTISGTSAWELWDITDKTYHSDSGPGEIVIVTWVKLANSVDASNSVTHIKIPLEYRKSYDSNDEAERIFFGGYSPYASVMSIDTEGASVIATKHSLNESYTPSSYATPPSISSLTVPSITSTLPSGSMHIGIVGGEYYGDYWPEGTASLSSGTYLWPTSVVPSGSTLLSRGELGLSYYKTLSSAGTVPANNISLNSATTYYQAVSIGLQASNSGTYHTIRRKLFQENGALYPSGTVVYAQNFENPLSLTSGTVGNWNGSGRSLLGNDSDSTINSSSGEVGFSFNNAGRYAIMVKPSVDTNGLISNYITSTPTAIFSTSSSIAFTTHRTHSTNNINITTSGLASGSTLYYSIEGNSPYGTPGHFLNNLSGSFTTTGNTTILPLHSTTSATSGTYNVKIRKFSTSGTIIASTGNISFGSYTGTRSFGITGPTQTYATLSNTFTANVTTSSSSNQMSAQRLFYSIDSDANGTAYSNSSHFSTLTGTVDITSLTSGNGSQTFAVTATSSLPDNTTYYVSLRKDNATGTGSNIVATSSQVTHSTSIPYIAYVTSNTYSGNEASFTLSGIQANDFIMVASAADNDSTSTITATNAGTITKDQANTGSGPYHAVHYFHATGTSTEINVYAGNWIAFAFRNVNTTTPLDVTTTTSIIGSYPNPPAITTSTDNTMIVAFGFIDDRDVNNNNGNPLIAPSGYSVAAFNFNNSYNASVMAIYKALPSAGTDDPGEFGGDYDATAAMTFALRGII